MAAVRFILFVEYVHLLFLWLIFLSGHLLCCQGLFCLLRLFLDNAFTLVWVKSGRCRWLRAQGSIRLALQRNWRCFIRLDILGLRLLVLLHSTMHFHRDMMRFWTLGSVIYSKWCRKWLIEVVVVTLEASVLGIRLQSRLYLSVFEHLGQAAWSYTHLYHLIRHECCITHHVRTTVHVLLLLCLLLLV